MPQEQTKALSLAGQELPSYLTASTDGREQIDASDLSLPRLLVMNPLSDQVKNEVARAGDLVENVTGTVLYERKQAIPLKGVFIAQRRMRQKWTPKGQAIGIQCYSPDGRLAINPNGIAKGVSTDDCSICEHANFTKDAEGKTVAPLCTEYREFLFLAEGYPLPLILSLGKSAAKIGKKLVEKLNADMGMTNRPMYAFQFALSTVAKQNGGNDWWAAEIKPSGFPSEALFLAAQKLYSLHKNSLHRAVAVREDSDTDSASVVSSGPTIG